MRVIPLIPAMLWAMLMLLAFGLPPAELPGRTFFNFPGASVLVHFVLFTILAILLAWGFYKRRMLRKADFFLKNHLTGILLPAAILGSAYGLLTELMQFMFFHARQGSWLDVGINFFGTIFGLILFTVIVHFCSRSGPKDKPSAGNRN